VSHQPLRVPNGYHRKGSGATLGDNHRGSLITGGKPHFSQNNKNTNELTNRKLHPTQSRPGDRSPQPQQPKRPTERSAPTPLGRNPASLEGDNAVPLKLRLARGLDAPSGKTPPRSRATHPLRQDSTSLEGWTPPRVILRLARGLCAPSGGTPARLRLSRVRRPAAPTPTSPIGALNTLTQRGRPGQRRIPSIPTH
jgi:hypothetical protein